MKASPNPKTVFTVVFVSGLLALTGLRVNGWRLLSSWSDWRGFQSERASASPEDAIYSMIDAERAGNTKAYLDSFTGSMRNNLLQMIEENSESKFASYLTRNATFQGVAVAVIDRPGTTDAQVRVEFVYGDRNEVQNMYLRREGQQWRVYRTAGAEQQATPFAFGSRVTD
jgi:hypothetical protein